MRSATVHPFPARKRPGRLFLLACAIAALLTLGFAAWIQLRLGGALLTETIDDFGQAGAGAIAIAACALAAMANRGRMRVAWSLLAASAAAWTIGDGAWSFLEIVQRHQVPFPAPSRAGYLAAVPAVIAAIAVYPGRRQTISRLAGLLDGSIVAGALLLLSTATVLGSVYLRVSTAPISAALFDVAYPLSDIAIATTALLLLRRLALSTRISGSLLVAGVLVNAISDSGVAYLSSSSQYGSSQLIDAGWVAGYLLIALGALRAGLSPASDVTAETPWARRAMVSVPYVLLALAGAAVLERQFSGVNPFRAIYGLHNVDEFAAVDQFLLWTAVTVFALVMVRQALLVWENQSLQQKLQAQADALRESEAHFGSLVQNSGDVVVLTDDNGMVQFASSSIDRFFAYSATELSGQSFTQFVHPSDEGAFLGALRKALTASAHPVTVGCRFRHKLGSWTHCEITITNMLHQASPQAVVLNIRDVTDRKEMEERMAHMAAHDPVTSLPNRIAFRNQVDETLLRSQPGRGAAVLTLDIDDFGVINDSLGQRAGDDLLGMIGVRLEKIIRQGDVVARVGGDEYAVLMKTVLQDDQPVQLADRIFELFRAPFRVEEREVLVRLSIGIAVQTRVEDTAETLMRNADIAVKWAKAHGKGRWERYAPEQQASISDRMELQTDLQHAIERRQLVLHYQPSVRLRDGAVLGFEGLLRWNHPRRGLLAAGEFIPLAEETGLVGPLQRWVLGQACADGRQWQWQVGQSIDPGLTVSVNVSHRGLADDDLAGDIMHACASAGFETRRLVLELTKGASLEGSAIVSKLVELHNRGVKLALDNFGADAAPLTALRDLPVDFVKLDRSFVDRMTNSPTDWAVARAVTELGNSLKIMTMADGIERVEQLAALKSIGCYGGQGYFVSRPLPASGIGRFLAECIVEGGTLRMASFGTAVA